jgi:5-methylcytosine-specific restriction endonuclease McrA
LPPRVKYRDKFANLGAVCQRCGADISHKSVVAKFCSRYCKTRTNDDERLKSGYFKTRYAANNEELKEEARVRMANRREADPAFRRSQAYLVGKRRKHVALIQDGTVDFKVILGERKSCPYCGQVLCEENTVVDHMEPLALNGEHSANNLVACCRECNQKKAAKPFIVWLGELPEARRAAAERVYRKKRGTYPSNLLLPLSFG